MEQAESHLQLKETRKYFFGGMVAMAGKTKEEERLPRISMAQEPLSFMRLSFGSFLPTIRERITLKTKTYMHITNTLKASGRIKHERN